MSTLKPGVGDEERDRDLELVIKQFLSYYDELYETRIQKLVFYTEVYAVCYYQKRVTAAEYRPYMYGAYSGDVADALEQMDGIGRSRRVRYGNRTVVYSYEGEVEDLDRTRREIVRCVHEHTRETSTEDLAQFSKDSWLFEKTEYDEPMQFDEFREALDDYPEVEEELKRQLPDTVDKVDESDLKPLDSV
jgi:uncharacterized protein YwgA